MAVINTNSGAMRAQNASRLASASQATAMERLSTGKRINSAKDDAAGLAISNSMTAQIKGMNQGIRNANDGISLAQTAEGALGEVTNILQRVRELTVQAGSETYSSDDRDSMQAEVTALTTQVSDIMENTKFNGIKLFTNATPTTAATPAAPASPASPASPAPVSPASPAPASPASPAPASPASPAPASPASPAPASPASPAPASPASPASPAPASPASPAPASPAASNEKILTIQTGANGLDKVEIKIKAIDLLAITGSAAVVDDATTTTVDETAAAVAGLNIRGDNGDNARTALGKLDTAIKDVSASRADLGAVQSRLDSVVNVQTSNATNLSDARSRIEDTDYSLETTSLAKAQILSQASQAMLAQANQSSQGVMSLLR